MVIFRSPPSRTIEPNHVGGDCFFRRIETATGHSVHSQRVDLPLAMKGGVWSYIATSPGALREIRHP